MRVTDKQGSSENSLTSVYGDKEGNILIGTYLKGLNRIRFYSTAEGLVSKTVYPIFQDSSNFIWLGGDLTRFAQNEFYRDRGKRDF